MKSLITAVIMSLIIIAFAGADYLTCDSQPSGAVTKYKIDLNGEIFPADAEGVGTDQVRLHYNIDHLGDGKYNVVAAAGNDGGEWSSWSEELEFYRGVPTPQTISLYCVVEESIRLPRENWKVYYVSSEEIVNTNKPATNAIDGKASSLWISEWVKKYPHEIQIDLGRMYHISKLYYLPRQDTYRGGLIKGYEIYVSLDGVDWKKVVSGEFPDSNNEQTVEFDVQAARYISLVALSEVTNIGRAGIAEINILGY